MKVYIVGHGGNDYTRMYEQDGWKVVDDIKNADLVQFTGGEDVSPKYYGCGKHPATANNEARDLKEEQIFEFCSENEIPMVGICRGGQFLNVMCGGRMYQHVDGHATGKTHEVTDTITGYRCNVTSTHHQMMIPRKSDGGVNVIGIVNPSLSSFKDYVDRDGVVFTVEPEEDEQDVEVIHYVYHNVLCFQPHPEFEDGKACREWFFSLVKRQLFRDPSRYRSLIGLDEEGEPKKLRLPEFAGLEVDEEDL
jgi:gamma-glutamyl-gamma-aminobutyrate hydrolase PuuD